MKAHKLITRSPNLDAGAVFSPCERYRYLLWRQWMELGARAGTVVWCMLNPSTADELALDPTLTRCKGFTRRLGYSRFEVVNLFALRSTDPAALHHVADPVGPDNDDVIAKAFADAEIVIVGWGAFPLVERRALRIAELAGNAGKRLHCLGTTKQGRGSTCASHATPTSGATRMAAHSERSRIIHCAWLARLHTPPSIRCGRMGQDPGAKPMGGWHRSSASRSTTATLLSSTRRCAGRWCCFVRSFLPLRLRAVRGP